MNIIPFDLFQNNIPRDIEYIARTLNQKGFEVFLVGGAVRDMVLAEGYNKANLKNSDFDFTTNAKPEEVILMFNKKGKEKVFTIPTGIAHGTVTIVIFRDNTPHHYEITTYRVDHEYIDGRHPVSVHYSNSLLEDLSRRDFTINALAYDVFKKEIIDPFGGLTDLKNKVIRTVGEPLLRFQEDGLRPIRACRLAAQLEFKIEQNVLDAIPGVHHVISKVSAERVHDELIKLMKARLPSIGLEYMRTTGILNLFMPELLEGYEVYQNEFHKYDVYHHNIYSCDAVNPSKPLVRLAALLHDIGKPRAKKYAEESGNGNVFYNHEVIGEKITERILRRLKFSNHEVRTIKKLVKLHMFYYTDEWSDGAVRRFLRKLNADSIELEDLFELRKADRIGSGMRTGEADILDKFKKRIQKVIEEDNALKVTDLDINGHDIMNHFKIGPSKLIGEMLEYMLQKVLDNPELNEKEKLLKIGEDFIKKFSNEVKK